MNLSTLVIGRSSLLIAMLAFSFLLSLLPSSSVQGFVQPFRLSTRAPRATQQSMAVQVNGDSKTATTEANGADDDYMWEIRLNVFEKAKTVTSVCTSGTLCTVSSAENIEGAPFGSFVDYVLDDAGNPVLLMNKMSMHTMNIRDNALTDSGRSNLVTLFTQLNGSSASKKGQDVGRCSLTCKVEKIDANDPEMDALRMRYSITHTYADQVMDSPKFAFYRLVPEKIYYVGGFGVLAKWVDVQDYKDAAPDILATEANSIVTKLNRDHQADLSLTAQHLLGAAPGSLEAITVTNVDRLGLDIRVTTQQGTRRNKLSTDEFRIGFRIPVISVEDAKSEVLKIFQEAWEKANGITWGDEGEAPGSTVPILKIAADSLE